MWAEYLYSHQRDQKRRYQSKKQKFQLWARKSKIWNQRLKYINVLCICAAPLERRRLRAHFCHSLPVIDNFREIVAKWRTLARSHINWAAKFNIKKDLHFVAAWVNSQRPVPFQKCRFLSRRFHTWFSESWRMEMRTVQSSAAEWTVARWQCMQAIVNSNHFP